MALKLEQDSVSELVRKAENDYISGTTNISKYVEFSQYETIERIDAYLNSKHISGDQDAMGRDKPFFNIVAAAVNIWYRATDIDRKNIKIKPTKRSMKVPAFVATLLLQQWMRKTKFGAFLNEWGRSLARYGSSVVKFVEKGGDLIPSVIPWNRLISDTVDFENNPKIEVLWMTSAQLRKNKAYDQEMVESLLETKQARETTGRQNKDNKADYIKLYEVHGEMPLSYLTGKDADSDEYVQQMHVVTFIARKEGRKTEYDDFCLYKGKEAKDPYMITHLIPEDGRALSIGAVEYLFEAQWMKNHTVKAMKDYLDVASKLIMQTSDGNLIGQNVLSAMESGDIIIHQPGAPLTVMNTAKADITAVQNFGTQWEILAKEITSTPDAMRGDTMPSGTAWRQVEALRVESHSLFELMTENKGLHIVDMMTDYVIPHLKKKLDTGEEIAAELDSAGVMEFDSMYVPNEAIRRDNEQLKKTILSGEVAYNLDPNQLQQDIKNEMKDWGMNRFLKPSDLKGSWKKELEDLEWQVEVDVTGEETDKNAVMTTLTTVLQTIATNPMVLQDPNMKILFNRILEETGAISVLELSSAQQPMNQPPQQAPAGGGSNVEQPLNELSQPNG